MDEPCSHVSIITHTSLGLEQCLNCGQVFQISK